jgi:hypothetical protein
MQDVENKTCIFFKNTKRQQIVAAATIVIS